MKRILKFLFNLARTLSLLLVLSVLGIFVYLYYSGDLEKLLLELDRGRLPAHQYGVVSAPVQIQKKQEPAIREKIALTADRSTHFIYPDRVAYFCTDGRHVKAVLINGDPIVKISANIKEIAGLLEDFGEHAFFKTASQLINRKYVRQYLPKNVAAPLKSNYVYHVIMEMGDTLIIPQDRAAEFRNSMADFALSTD